jgi:hypothetical protein
MTTACKEGKAPECSWRPCRTCTLDMPHCTLKERACNDKGTLLCKSCSFNSRSLAYKKAKKITCGFPKLNTNEFISNLKPGESGVTAGGIKWQMSPIA